MCTYLCTFVHRRFSDMRVSRSRSRRRRVGRVTVYQRGRRFWVYYRQGGEVIRRAVGVDRAEALSLAARINAELAEGSPTSLDVPGGYPERSVLTIADRLAPWGHLTAGRLDLTQDVFRFQHHLFPFVTPPVPPARSASVPPARVGRASCPPESDRWFSL
nr:hypothetical protein fc96 [uncultured bacterium]